MSREIKFRIWYNASGHGQMIYPENSAKLYLSLDGNLFENYGKRDADLIDSVFDADWDLMQFTGLKDKNGKEIYEGDIVEDWGEISPVIWTSMSDGYDYDGWAADFGLYSGVKVIGNIYENPELIK